MDEGTATLTLNYQRVACLFLSSRSEEDSCNSGAPRQQQQQQGDTNTALIQRLEQHLGRSTANDKVEATTKIAMMPFAESTALDLRVPSSFLCCETCGSWMQPGQNGTTLRLRRLRRGSTRRRRASRRKASELSNKRQSTVAGGRMWKETTDSYKMNRQNGNDDAILCVTDGRARCAVVVKCGLCGSRRKCRGIPIRKSISPTAAARDRTNGHKQKQKNDGKRAQKESTQLDFVPLQEKASSTKLELGGRTKKRGRKRKQSMSGLMGFLSSLND